jgi:N-acetyl-gamma-glutamyl-phosphate reductase
MQQYADSMHKVAVGVLGASGYAGRELCAIIARHPDLELTFAAANGQRGRSTLVNGRDITFVAAEDAPLHRTDLVFSALPHGTSMAWVHAARDAGARVVDLSADLRPGGEQQHVAPYGLTELARASIPGALVIANPGCYPTAILLAIAPLIAGGYALPGSTISIVAASGVTGAGYTPRHELLFGEVAEDYRPYAVGNAHRHLAEMRAVVATLGGDQELIFTPHLLPVARGILATITVPVVSHLDNPLAPWLSHYGGEPFVEISAEPPALRDVVRRNVVRISAVHAAGMRQPALVVTAAIDNLLKGAAGQAVQNANLLLGFPEPHGLPA